MIVKYLVNVLVSSLLSILIQQVSDFVGFSLLCIAVAAAECSRIASGACCLEEAWRSLEPSSLQSGASLHRHGAPGYSQAWHMLDDP